MASATIIYSADDASSQGRQHQNKNRKKVLIATNAGLCSSLALSTLLKNPDIEVVGISPPIAAASLKALEILETEPHRVRHIQHNGEVFKKLAEEAGLDTGLSMGLCITPIIIGSSIKATRLSNMLFEKGINAQPIIYPAVEERAARLRFFICTSHTEEQIEKTVQTIKDQLAKI